MIIRAAVRVDVLQVNVVQVDVVQMNVVQIDVMETDMLRVNVAMLYRCFCDELEIKINYLLGEQMFVYTTAGFV